MGSFYCATCHTKPVYDADLDGWSCECPIEMYDDGYKGGFWPAGRVRAWNAGRHEMHVKVGDRVIYPRRPSAPGGSDLVIIDGVGYVMFNEEQSALAVIEA